MMSAVEEAPIAEKNSDSHDNIDENFKIKTQAEHFSLALNSGKNLRQELAERVDQPRTTAIEGALHALTGDNDDHILKQTSKHLIDEMGRIEEKAGKAIKTAQTETDFTQKHKALDAAKTYLSQLNSTTNALNTITAERDQLQSQRQADYYDRLTFVADGVQTIGGIAAVTAGSMLGGRDGATLAAVGYAGLSEFASRGLGQLVAQKLTGGEASSADMDKRSVDRAITTASTVAILNIDRVAKLAPALHLPAWTLATPAASRAAQQALHTKVLNPLSHFADKIGAGVSSAISQHVPHIAQPFAALTAKAVPETIVETSIDQSVNSAAGRENGNPFINFGTNYLQNLGIEWGVGKWLSRNKQLHLNESNSPHSEATSSPKVNQDPLLKEFSTPRSVRMQQPENIKIDGHSYFIAEADEKGLILHNRNTINRSMPYTAAEGRNVIVDGKNYSFVEIEVDRPNKRITYHLSDEGRDISFPQESKVIMPFSNGSTYELLNNPPNAFMLINTQKDIRPEARIDFAPNMSFEARLKGREQEGVYYIHVDEKNQLNATLKSNPEDKHIITPEKIAPTYVIGTDTSLAAPNYVDTFLNAETLEKATKPFDFGFLPENVSPAVSMGAESLPVIRSLIQSAQPEANVSIFNYYLDSLNGSVTPSMKKSAKNNADVTLNATFKNRDQKLKISREEISAFMNDGVNVRQPPTGTLGIFQHAKLIYYSKNDKGEAGAFFGSMGFDDRALKKKDFYVQFKPDEMPELNDYLNNALNKDYDRVKRREQLISLAEKGVVFNDPIARYTMAGNAMHNLIENAQSSVEIWMGDVKHSATTAKILEKASQGLNVSLYYRNIDPDQMDLIERSPHRDNIKLEYTKVWDPYPHFNTVIADGEKAYLGTAYFWQPMMQMNSISHSFDSGVLIQGESVQKLIQQLRQMEKDSAP